MKPDLTHLDPYRLKDPYSEPGATYGAFSIPNPLQKGTHLEVIACDGGDHSPEIPGTGWDHVSAKVRISSSPSITRVPSWYEMDALKDLFFLPSETVLQFHVPKADKVNWHSSCLHLWRPCGDGAPALPPKECV